MADDQPGTVLLEGARLIFRNFQGKEGPYNREGDRNFGVIIPDPAVAEQMLSDGWNVKYLKPSEEEQEQGIEQGPPWLQVKVKYDGGRPPKIFVITERGRTLLDDDTVEMLDWADVQVDSETGNPKVDLIVRPFPYEVHGRSGLSAYVQSMYITIEEDPLEKKYAEMDAQ